MNQTPDQKDVILRGLDGSNPLGFLASIGVLVQASKDETIGVKMGWVQEDTWHPFLRICPALSTESLLEILLNGLKAQIPDASLIEEEVQLKKQLEEAKRKRRFASGPTGKESTTSEESADLAAVQKEFEKRRKDWLSARKKIIGSAELALGDSIVVPSREFRELTELLAGEADPKNRTHIDMMGAFGCEACVDPKTDRLDATPFCFINGSGHQWFLGTVNELMMKVDRERIRKCLFEPWMYEDDKLSMRWDPVEDRRYALMWDDPSKVKVKTVWAANLLAYRGLQLFPSVIEQGTLGTTGFETTNKRDYFTWPLWNGPLSLDVVRSVLSLKELRNERPDRTKLSSMGIREIFRSERIKVGSGGQYKVNFTPAGPVL
jgi:hypothetical protein